MVWHFSSLCQLCDYSFSLTWSLLVVEQGELSEVAENHEIFQAVLGQISPRPSAEEKQVQKLMKWISEANL